MGCLVWYMLLTVGAVELGLGLWDPSGMSGVGYVTNSGGSRVGTWALGPKWDVWCGICYFK